MSDSTDSNSNQLVVLIHGLASSRWLMHPLRFRLKQKGFQVRTYSYFTFGGNIDAIAHRFSDTLAAWAVATGANQVHIVAHSMGAIVTRRLLLEPIAFPLGKVVMLAPPHHGSHVATRLSKPLSAICPALHRLADTPGSYVRQLGIPQGHDIGVIAADGDLVAGGIEVLDAKTEAFEQAQARAVEETADEGVLAFEPGEGALRWRAVFDGPEPAASTRVGLRQATKLADWIR